MAVAAAVAIAGLGISVYKTLHAAHKEKVAREAQQGLVLPFYKIQDEYYQNQNLANANAQGGFSQSAKDLYSSEAERGYGAGVQGILNAGGSANDIAKLNDSFSKSLFNLSAADAQAQMQNIQYFMKANSELADQKTIQFLVNQKQPYENAIAQLNQTQAAEQQNINQGLSDAIGSAGSLATILQNKNLDKGGGGGDDLPISIKGRPDPFHGATAPITSATNTDYLKERTIGSGAAPTLNLFRNSESPNAINNLSDSERLNLIGSLLKQNIA